MTYRTPLVAISRFLCVLICLTMLATASAQQLSRAELESIGKRIWQSEAAGKVEGLTAWNQGEDFASLGIGHFIWYPAETTNRPFEESFPPLIAFMRQSGVQVPQWLQTAQACPWPNRKVFMESQNSPQLVELRQLLASTVAIQTQYIINRLHAATSKMQQAAGPFRDRVTANIQLLSQTAAGNYAMIDYINFKGDGLKVSERYRGQGWGLLQVLIEMNPTATAAEAPKEFARASKVVMTRRVENSPPERNEKRWLKGWLNRCEGYGR